MERLHMNYLRDILYRLRKGESERRIALDQRFTSIMNWPGEKAT